MPESILSRLQTLNERIYSLFICQFGRLLSTLVGIQLIILVTTAICVVPYASVRQFFSLLHSSLVL